MLLFIISIFAGFVGALLGLGGGIVIIPATTLFLGVGIHEAIGASIVAVIATSCASASAYVRDNVANIRVASFLEFATTTGALIGALLASQAPGKLLSVLFGIFLLYSAYTMFQRRKQSADRDVLPHPMATRLGMCGAYYDRALDKTVDYNVTGLEEGFGIMFGAGLMSGLLGIGSGALKVLGMDAAMKLPMKVSTATSNLMMGVTAAVSAGYYFSKGLLQPSLAGPIVLGVFLGARLGSMTMTRIKGDTLRKIFIPILVITALQMLYKGITP